MEKVPLYSMQKWSRFGWKDEKHFVHINCTTNLLQHKNRVEVVGDGEEIATYKIGKFEMQRKSEWDQRKTNREKKSRKKKE